MPRGSNHLLFGSKNVPGLTRAQKQQLIEQQERDDFIKSGGDIRTKSGIEIWSFQGKLHRENGPCLISEAVLEWRIHDQYHRTNGPAREFSDGSYEYYQNGRRHRLDGPAVLIKDSKTEWWLNGELHRANGPARIRANGDKEWWLNGQLHRTDGPAMESMPYRYFIQGMEYSRIEYEKKQIGSF